MTTLLEFTMLITLKQTLLLPGYLVIGIPILIRLNIPLSNARGQCYDSVKNMRGIKNGVSNKNFIRKSKSIFHTLF